uniref:4-hydroxythreonine-4-phosphate dehydrogenase PdxA n=1 Tax=Candidatus Electronema sp. TaxID=2698783 RepID=UPI0040573D40
MKPAAITMGCPVGVGPEIILRFFDSLSEAEVPSTPVVLGDLGVLTRAAALLGSRNQPVAWNAGEDVTPDTVPVLELSQLDADKLSWGQPTKESATAMAEYIRRAAAGALAGDFSAVITCPISKKALNEAGIWHPGHTEMLASLTETSRYRMMLAGTRLRVVLVTIHEPLAKVSHLLTVENILGCIRMTADALRRDFGMEKPRIAVAGFNPHSGEQGMFGREEIEIIEPAVRQYEGEAEVSGPWPPDTVFYKAANGAFDAVVCMYHDQGLIPFKLLHFQDGVNVTLGLPIVRTSVDHGTAYDIAGKGCADAASLRAAWQMAMEIARNRAR